MAAEIHVGDIGTAIVITIKDEEDAIVDVSAATEKKIYFLKPDKSLLTKTATFGSAASGSDGTILYSFTSGELDQAGTWRGQGKVVLTSGQWYSSQFSFGVVGNLEDC